MQVVAKSLEQKQEIPQLLKLRYRNLAELECN